METTGAHIPHDVLGRLEENCYFDCSQDAGELFSVRQSCVMCAQELLSTLAGSSKLLAASCLGADEHQLMTRAETGGGRSPQMGLGGRRGAAPLLVLG